MTREEVIGKLLEYAAKDGQEVVKQMLRYAFPLTINDIETAAAGKPPSPGIKDIHDGPCVCHLDKKREGIDSHDADALVQAIVEGRKADALEIVRSLRAHPGDHLHPKTEPFLEGLRPSRKA